MADERKQISAELLDSFQQRVRLIYDDLGELAREIECVDVGYGSSLDDIFARISLDGARNEILAARHKLHAADTDIISSKGRFDAAHAIKERLKHQPVPGEAM